MSNKEQLKIIPNHNPDLCITNLADDSINYDPIVAWCVNLRILEEQPYGEFVTFATPVSFDGNHGNHDGYAIVKRTTGQWWIPFDSYGSDLEDLQTHMANFQKETKIVSVPTTA